MLVGKRMGITVVTPAGAVDLVGIIMTAWLDGFQHAAATAAGLRGESNEEIVRRATE